LLSNDDSMAICFCDSISDCKKFKDTVEEIAEQQGKSEEKENDEVSTAASDLAQKLTVAEPSKEENAEKEEAPASDDKKDDKE
jgi:Ran-binding protein 1